MLRRLRRAIRASGAERKLVWIMGSPRSGSTWLLNMLATDGRVAKIDEPLVAAHLGVRAGALVVGGGSSFDEPLLQTSHAARDDYVFSDRFAAVWRPALRRLIVERFAQQGRSARWIVIKEPHGSEAAPLVFSVVPRSRLIFLVRHAGDVADSVLDMALAAGAPGSDREAIVTEAVRAWVKRMTAVRASYDGLPDAQRLLVRYEDLRADPAAGLTRVAAWLGLDASADVIADVAERFAFERVPDDAKGAGKFQRAASPGLWRDNLTPAEQRIVSGTAGELLTSLGYEP